MMVRLLVSYLSLIDLLLKRKKRKVIVAPVFLRSFGVGKKKMMRKNLIFLPTSAILIRNITTLLTFKRLKKLSMVVSLRRMP